MGKLTKDQLAAIVKEIIDGHQVTLEICYDWGVEIVPHCTSCGYFGDKENPTLHTANIVIEYLEDYFQTNNDRNIT